MSKFLTKFDRLSAWILFGAIFLNFVSGYGMTKGIISYSLASKLHLDYLPLIAIVFFTVHTWYAIHLAFKRWRIWNPFSKIILAIFYLIFLGYFIWVDRFYTPAKITTNKSVAISATNNSTGTTSVDPTAQSTEKTFTLAQLAQYDGTNGRPAYVAIDGVVYDLSSVFRNGTHHGFSAGLDQSAAFHSQHYDGILNNYPIVGKLTL